MKDREQTFRYTYSATEQSEIARIRKKYIQPQENTLEQLRRLDRSVSQKAQAWALVLGIIGALLLGTGMSVFMTELGETLGALAMPVGILVGLAGMVLAALAYPVYNHILSRERQRIAPEILRLTEELMK